jgi:uroporphyrinogen III methyltransferase/synthase
VTSNPEIAGLRGKTILITRQLEQSSDFVAEVERRGGRAIVIPMIRIAEPDSWEECDRAFDQVTSYDAVVFTSVNGVQKLLHRCEARGVALHALRSAEIYAVGRKTQLAIERAGLAVRFVPEIYSGESLAKHFESRDFSGKRVLLLRGDRGRRELETVLAHLGASVHAVVVYKNIQPDLKNGDTLWNCLENGDIDVVTFASPSAAANFSIVVPAEKLSSLSKRVLVGVIGPTTREAVIRYGYHADIVAQEATVDGLIDAIVEHFVSR